MGAHIDKSSREKRHLRQSSLLIPSWSRVNIFLCSCVLVSYPLVSTVVFPFSSRLFPVWSRGIVNAPRTSHAVRFSRPVQCSCSINAVGLATPESQSAGPVSVSRPYRPYRPYEIMRWRCEHEEMKTNLTGDDAGNDDILACHRMCPTRGRSKTETRRWGMNGRREKQHRYGCALARLPARKAPGRAIDSDPRIT